MIREPSTDPLVVARVEIEITVDGASALVFLNGLKDPASGVVVASLLGPWASASGALVAVLNGTVKTICKASAGAGIPIRAAQFVDVVKTWP